MKKIRVLLCFMILLGVQCLLLVGCNHMGFSNSKSERSIEIKFTNYEKDMEKTVDIENVQKKMSFNYSNFKLKAGEIVVQIVTKDNEVVFEKKLTHEDDKKGTINVENLKVDNKYSLKVFGIDAVKGSIKLKW